MRADSGKRFSTQSRRSWQVPEHDGLLGSGSFPRPSGFSAGASAPRFRSNDSYQLGTTNEPYHPPRPYKVLYVHFLQFFNENQNHITSSVDCGDMLTNVQCNFIHLKLLNITKLGINTAGGSIKYISW